MEWKLSWRKTSTYPSSTSSPRSRRLLDPRMKVQRSVSDVETTAAVSSASPRSRSGGTSMLQRWPIPFRASAWRITRVVTPRPTPVSTTTLGRNRRTTDQVARARAGSPSSQPPNVPRPNGKCSCANLSSSSRQTWSNSASSSPPLRTPKSSRKVATQCSSGTYAGTAVRRSRRSEIWSRARSNASRGSRANAPAT